MSKTDTDLVTKALIDETRARVAQTDDIARVSGWVDPFLARLEGKRITGTIVKTAIPDTLFLDLVALFREHIAENLGNPVDEKIIVLSEGRLRELTRLDRSASSGLVRRVLEQLEIYSQGRNALDATAISDRLQEIFDDLSLRQVIYIPDVDDVPPQAMPELTRFIAASLSSPTQYDVMEMAERRLRKLRPAGDPYPVLEGTFF